jgi:MFS superfamily sulfate permease-like transporter
MAFLLQALGLYGRYFAAVVLIGFGVGLGILLTTWWKNR